ESSRRGLRRPWLNGGSNGPTFAPSERFERFAAHSHVAPLIQKLGPHGRVEVDSRRIPVQNLPLQTLAALLDGDCRHLLQQRLADAAAAQFRLYEEIFQVNARPAHPGGVVVEIERKAGRSSVVLGNQAFIKGVRAETVAQQPLFRGGNCVRRPLIRGQGADKGKNLFYVCRCGRANRRSHASILECDTRHAELLLGGTRMNGRSLSDATLAELHPSTHVGPSRKQPGNKAFAALRPQFLLSRRLAWI